MIDRKRFTLLMLALMAGCTAQPKEQSGAGTCVNGTIPLIRIFPKLEDFDPAGWDGKQIQFAYDVGADGKVGNSSILSTTASSEATAEASRAFSRFQFKPGVKDGKAFRQTGCNYTMTLERTPTEADLRIRSQRQFAIAKTKRSFCADEKVLGCIQITKEQCQANIESYVKPCADDRNPDLKPEASDEDTYAYYMGCAVGTVIGTRPEVAATFNSCMGWK